MPPADSVLQEAEIVTLHLAEIVSEEPLRVLLVGLGKMGQLHMECLSKMPGVSLVGIVDEDEGKEIAANGIPFARSIDGLANEFAAAVIAVPVERHAEAAVPLLARGIDCLVEKPLSLCPGEIETMIAAARTGGARLSVAQVERFNPAIESTMAALRKRSGKVRVQRLSRMQSVSGGPDVIADLMVHDLDWIVKLEGTSDCEITVLESRRTAGCLDHVCCRLGFGDRSYELAAVHGASERKRSLDVRLDGGETRCFDLLALSPDGRPDPLTRQAEVFVMSRAGDAAELATAEEALAVLRLSDAIRRCAFETSKLPEGAA